MNTNIDTIKIQMNKILSTTDNDGINVCYIVFNLICQSDKTDQPILFEYFCNIYGTIDSNEEKPVPKEITSQELVILKNHLKDFVNGKLQSTINRDLEETLFYKNIWDFITDTINFSNNKEMAFALYWIVIDRKIPYFRLSGTLRMSNEEFSSAQDKLIRSIQKIRYILASDFDQKTEKAYHLLQELDLYNESPNHKAVLMARIISEFEKRENRIIEALSDR